MALIRTFEPIKVNPYNVQTYRSWFFYNQGDMVKFLCSYGFWFNITKGIETQQLCLRILIRYNQGDGVTFLDHV